MSFAIKAGMALARLPPPTRPVRAGNGRYEVGQLLGRGGMAEVFDGRSLGSHGFEKRVAIKRILPELAGDATFTSRLVVEAKLAVAMQHVNIVQALDLVRDGRDVFLVMEFVNGPTLRRLLQERYASGGGPLPLGLSTFVLHEAAAGLDYAHTQPGGAVIHADISPSNLLISRAGEVKLADFGIARREGIARAAEGKWGYMAPEQERGEALSPRADLYALGVVLYELLTGVHPFSTRTPKSARVSEPAISPHLVRPDLPRPISDLCMQMLAPDVAGRPASAKEVAERLAELRYLEGWREARSELAAAIAQLVPELVTPMPAHAGASMTGSMMSGASGASMPSMSASGMSGASRASGFSESMPAASALPPRLATEHTQHPLRNATEMTNRPLTLVTSSLLAEPGLPGLLRPELRSDAGETLGPAGAAIGTSTGGHAGQGEQGALHSPVPGSLSSVTPGMHVLHSPVPGSLAGVSVGPAGLAEAFSHGTWPGNAPVTFTAPARRPLVSVRTWIVLGLATLAGVLWGVRSVVREVTATPAAELQATAQEAPTPPLASATTTPPAPPGSTTAATAASAAPGGTIGSQAPPPPAAGGSDDGSAADPAAKLGAPIGSIGSTDAKGGPVEPAPVSPISPTAPGGGGKQPSSQVRPEAGVDGTLRVYAEPWAYVQVGDIKVETPARLTLRPGRHVVRMTNPELGLVRTQTVRIRSKEMTTLKVRWNE